MSHNQSDRKISADRSIQQALAQHRYETARRLAAQALKDGESFDLRVDLHEAYRRLGDYASARAARKAASPGHPDEAFAQSVLLAEDFYQLANDGHYRTSAAPNRTLPSVCAGQRYDSGSCSAVSVLSRVEVNDSRTGGVFLGPQMLHQSFHVVVMPCGHLILRLPDRLDDFILHHRLP